MPALDFKGYSIDDLSKAAGGLAIAAYVVGYITLSYYFSGFGFDLASPFRPRILAAGICTLLFFLIPIVLGRAAAALPRRSLNKPLIMTIRTLLLPFIAYSSMGLPGAIREVPIPFVSGIEAIRTSHLGFYVTIAVAVLAVGGLATLVISLASWIWQNYHRRPVACILILVPLSIGISVVALLNGSNTLESHLYIWFLAISAFICVTSGDEMENSHTDLANRNLAQIEELQHSISDALLELAPHHVETSGETVNSEFNMDMHIKRLLDGREELKRLAEANQLRTLPGYSSLMMKTSSPIQAFVWSLLALAIFTSYVYPKIPYRVGGGHIVPVTVYEIRPDKTLRTIHAGLIDQSDQGYYLLLPKHPKGFFLSKENVTGIDFSDEPDSLENTLTQ